MRISDWSSDVCSSDLRFPRHLRPLAQITSRAGDANSIVRLGLGLALVAPPQSDLFRDSAGIRQFLERPPRGNRRDRLEYHRPVMQFMVATDAPVPYIDAHRSKRPGTLTFKTFPHPPGGRTTEQEPR